MSGVNAVNGAEGMGDGAAGRQERKAEPAVRREAGAKAGAGFRALCRAGGACGGRREPVRGGLVAASMRLTPPQAPPAKLRTVRGCPMGEGARRASAGRQEEKPGPASGRCAGRAAPAGGAVNPSVGAWSPHPCGSHPAGPTRPAADGVRVSDGRGARRASAGRQAQTPGPGSGRCAGRVTPAGGAVNPSLGAWSPHPCGSHPRRPHPPGCGRCAGVRWERRTAGKRQETGTNAGARFRAVRRAGGDCGGRREPVRGGLVAASMRLTPPQAPPARLRTVRGVRWERRTAGKRQQPTATATATATAGDGARALGGCRR